MPNLRIYRGDQLQQTLQMGEAVLRIGRAPENDIVLPDEGKGVSRVHAEIRFEAGRYVIADLNSQNGVWLGTRRVQLDTLPLGVAVSIGSYRLVMEDEPITPTVSSDGTVAAPASADDVPPTLIDATTPPLVAPTPAPLAATGRVSPPVSPAANGKPRTALYSGVALAAIVASVVLVIAIRRAPEQPAPPTGIAQTPPPVPTPPVPPVVPVNDVLEGHLAKAAELIAASDKEGARRENEEALTAGPSDPRVAEQRAAIDALPDPVVETAATAPEARAGSPRGGDGGPGRVPVSPLAVVRRPGETPAQREARQRHAEGDLREGLKALKDGRLLDAKSSLQAAIEQSGRKDFGTFVNEAQNGLDRISDELKKQADDQKRNAAEELVKEARQATDPVVAIRKLQTARETWPQTEQADLLKEWLGRARSQGEAALTVGLNYERVGEKGTALTNCDRAAALLELLPGGHPRLAEARRCIQDSRSGK